MNTGLPISKLIAIAVSLATPAAQGINFSSMVILGDSNVINTKDRLRNYASLSAIGMDFGMNSPEYAAAVDYFSQQPKPQSLTVGRWAKTATSGLILGGPLTAAQQNIASWNVVNNGGFHIAVDGGAASNVTGLNFGAAANLNAVAATIQAAIQALGGSFANVTCTWNATYAQFQIASGTTGAASAVAALTAPAAGTDISGANFLQMTAATASELVSGVVAESALAAVMAIDSMPTSFYGLSFAAGAGNADVADSDYMAVGSYIEAASNPHLFGVTTSEAAALLLTDTTSIGAQMKTAGFNRSGVQWSSSSPYAIVSAMGRLLTTNFNGNNTTITIAWKQEPNISPEMLTLNQSDALDANNYIYFAAFNNNTSIIVNGTVASGHYFDEIIGADWLANYVQTNAYNELYTSPTKIPQTDSGMNIIATSIEGSCAQGVKNGLLGPGVWNSQGFGQLATGDYLANGYYVYTPPISSQSQADRSARKSVPFQVAAKFAGAVHDVDVSLTINQ